MVKNEIVMKKLLLALSLMAFSYATYAQTYTWKANAMDGSRTGCVAPSQDNIPEALGTFSGKSYVAPNGKHFDSTSATAKVARIVIDAQKDMARVKDVIAYSSDDMMKAYPESSLTNWYIDFYMKQVEKLVGKKIHIGVANFGGVRVDLPKGDVILDDILSMFPFKNNVIYIEHKGKTIRKILESMAANRFEILGGVKVVAENGKLVSVEVDGEPLDDEKVYGLATNSFLLYGGDGLYLAPDAVSLYDLGIYVIDVVLDYIKAETAAGRPLAGQVDGRVTIR